MMIIEKQTAAATGGVNITRGSFPKTICVVGTLDTDEFIDVYVRDKDNATNELYDDYGTAIRLGATSPPLAIHSPIDLAFSKPITDAAAGVMLFD